MARVGENEFRFELDPAIATEYSKNAVKTALGGKSFPFYSHVSFTLFTDGDRPLKTVCNEKKRVNKFGGTNCTAVYTEMFAF